MSAIGEMWTSFKYGVLGMAADNKNFVTYPKYYLTIPGSDKAPKYCSMCGENLRHDGFNLYFDATTGKRKKVKRMYCSKATIYPKTHESDSFTLRQAEEGDDKYLEIYKQDNGVVHIKNIGQVEKDNNDIFTTTNEPTDFSYTCGCGKKR